MAAGDAAADAAADAAEHTKRALREKLQMGFRQDITLRQCLAEQNMCLSHTLLQEQAHRGQLVRELREALAALKIEVEQAAKETAKAYDEELKWEARMQASVPKKRHPTGRAFPERRLSVNQLSHHGRKAHRVIRVHVHAGGRPILTRVGCLRVSRSNLKVKVPKEAVKNRESTTLVPDGKRRNIDMPHTTLVVHELQPHTTQLLQELDAHPDPQQSAAPEAHTSLWSLSCVQDLMRRFTPHRPEQWLSRLNQIAGSTASRCEPNRRLHYCLALRGQTLAAILTQNQAAQANMVVFLLQTQTREHAGMLAAAEDADMLTAALSASLAHATRLQALLDVITSQMALQTLHAARQAEELARKCAHLKERLAQSAARLAAEDRAIAYLTGRLEKEVAFSDRLFQDVLSLIS